MSLVANRAEVAADDRRGPGRRCNNRRDQRVLRFLVVIRVVNRQTALEEPRLETRFDFAGLLWSQIGVADGVVDDRHGIRLADVREHRRVRPKRIRRARLYTGLAVGKAETEVVEVQCLRRAKPRFVRRHPRRAELRIYDVLEVRTESAVLVGARRHREVEAVVDRQRFLDELPKRAGRNVEVRHRDLLAARRIHRARRENLAHRAVAIAAVVDVLRTDGRLQDIARCDAPRRRTRNIGRKVLIVRAIVFREPEPIVRCDRRTFTAIEQIVLHAIVEVLADIEAGLQPRLRAPVHVDRANKAVVLLLDLFLIRVRRRPRAIAVQWRAGTGHESIGGVARAAERLRTNACRGVRTLEQVDIVDREAGADSDVERRAQRHAEVRADRGGIKLVRSIHPFANGELHRIEVRAFEVRKRKDAQFSLAVHRHKVADRLRTAADLHSDLAARAGTERRRTWVADRTVYSHTVLDAGADRDQRQAAFTVRGQIWRVASDRVVKRVRVAVRQPSSFRKQLPTRRAGAAPLGRDDDHAVCRVGAIQRRR